MAQPLGLDFEIWEQSNDVYGSSVTQLTASEASQGDHTSQLEVIPNEGGDEGTSTK